MTLTILTSCEAEKETKISHRKMEVWASFIYHLADYDTILPHFIHSGYDKNWTFTN